MSTHDDGGSSSASQADIQDGIAYEAQRSLVIVQNMSTHEAAMKLLHILFRINALEGDNIIHHLNLIMECVEKLDRMPDEHYKVEEEQFKIIILSSLPPSWDLFSDAYTNIFAQYTPNELINFIKEEYLRRTHGDQNYPNTDKYISDIIQTMRHASTETH
jgi:hypothetical protein